MQFHAHSLPVPSYLFETDELLALRERLIPFAAGDPDYTDNPCERANDCIVAIDDELKKRSKPIKL